MKNAEASVRMEGYTVTPEMREQCERVLWGEATGTTWLVWRYAKMIKYGLFQDNKLYLLPGYVYLTWYVIITARCAVHGKSDLRRALFYGHELPFANSCGKEENLTRPFRSTIVLSVLLLALSCISLFIGVVEISPWVLLSGDSNLWEIFLVSRLPRLLAILCTGIGMSVAGLIM